MRNQELAIFFEKMNEKLDEIKKEHDELNFLIRDEDDYDYYTTTQPDLFNSNINDYKKWKIKLLPFLNKSYKIRVNKMTLEIEKEFLILKTILRDLYFKYMEKSNSKENIEILQLLRAREENIDFEIDLVELIKLRQDDNNLPVTIEKLFTDLGYMYLSDIDDITNLKQLNIKEIHDFISNGLLRKKYYKDDCKYNSLDYKKIMKNITEDLKDFIQNSLLASETIDISTALDMNVNMELLFHNKANTKDKELNELIEEAKDRFISNDKQIGVEKLWDAFERLRTHFGKNKKVSATKVVKIISENFDDDFLTSEFLRLGKIGNNYRIRHHETDKKELNSKHINYFFFRMLSLIDLCLMYLNEEENFDS